MSFTYRKYATVEPSSEMTLVVRSNNDPQQLATAIKSKLRELDAGLPVFIQTWNDGLGLVLFPSRAAQPKRKHFRKTIARRNCSPTIQT